MLSRFFADCREMLGEQFEYRELLFQMTRRDLLIRYKQSVMGFGWAVFMPLVNTTLFSVIFARVADFHTPVPYPVFAYCGFWVWNMFSAALRFSVTSLTSNSNLVSKVYFPREIFPFSSIIVSLADFAVGGTVLVALLAWYRLPVGWHLLWFPVVLAVHLTFTTAVALLLSMTNLFYRDVKYLFEVGISVWMFGTSVIYPVDFGGRLGTAMQLNPMTAIVDSYRACLLMNATPPATLAAAAGLAVVALLGCWVFFHRLEFQFAENI